MSVIMMLHASHPDASRTNACGNDFDSAHPLSMCMATVLEEDIFFLQVDVA